MPVGSPTPIIISTRTRNIAAAALLLLTLYVFWQVPLLPKMLLTGAALALILSFPVRILSRWIPRGFAITFVMLVVVLLSVIAVVILVPVLIGQVTELVGNLPQYADTTDQRLRQVIKELTDRGLITSSPDQVLKDLQAEVFNRAQQVGQRVATGAFGAVAGLLSYVIAMFGVVFVTIYLLIDGQRFRTRMIRSVPLVYRDDVEDLWDDTGQAISKYLGGLCISLLFQGVCATAALYFLDVPYSLLLGIWMMISAIIPYVGSYIGGVPAVIAGFFVSPVTALLVVVAYFAINQIDGSIIAPRVQGQAIRVHPLFIFLAVIAGGSLFGLWGALIAVPFLAVLRTVIDFLDLRLQVEDHPTRVSFPMPVSPLPDPSVTADE